MSSDATKFVLDANVFIQAKRRFYPFAVCPGFWDALAWHQNQGILCSIDKVRAELEIGGDELWDWARDVFDVRGFRDTATATAEYGQMVAWVEAQSQFNMAAKSEFMNVADGWLAAYAKHVGFTLVTLEEHKPDAKSKVPLVNVCKAFDVTTITPFEMLRSLGVNLTWSPPS
ncbi:MAG: DUF4411 family protein [Verrucomicrobiaceae bacterium]|nr:DUF4411 family protein [Verrucomicrobiaceae bacterium]